MTTPPESYITELKKLPTRFDVKNFKPMNLEMEDPFTEDEYWHVKVQKRYNECYDTDFNQYIDEYENWKDINEVKKDTENPYKQFKAWEGVIIKGGSPVSFKFIHHSTTDGDVDLEVDEDEDVDCLAEFLCDKLIWENDSGDESVEVQMLPPPRRE